MKFPVFIGLFAYSLLFARVVHAQDFAKARELKLGIAVYAPMAKPAKSLKNAPDAKELLHVLARAERKEEGVRFPKEPEKSEGIIQAELALDGNEYIIDFPLPPPGGSRIYRFQSVRGPADKPLPYYELAPADARELGFLLKAFK